MRLKIYQINPDKDPGRLRYMAFKQIEKVDPTMYFKVLDAEVDVKGLEEAFLKFNNEGHPLHNGRSMSVSDIVVTEDGAFYCDSFGFKKTEFDESQVDTSNLIKVLFVRPNEDPYVAEIPDTLEAKQKAVGGYIEYVYNSDETALVGDEEAKLKGKIGNRYLDGGGIIAGDFLIVGLGEEDCRSLTSEEIDKYMEKYSNAPSITPEETAADVGFRYINFM
ncbi:YodL-like [Ruminococcaceae bacterium KH2T8]|nr:YodL-like [Ruminococcaceae bacterium KH2T8]